MGNAGIHRYSQVYERVAVLACNCYPARLLAIFQPGQIEGGTRIRTGDEDFADLTTIL